MAVKEVELALSLKRELEMYDRDKDRSVLIKALRDQFLMTRFSAAVETEKSRVLALEVLSNRMASMSDGMLFRAIELLAQIGVEDLTIMTKGAPGSIALQQNNISMNEGAGISQTGNPLKETGELLEALEHIARHFRGKTIDLEKEDK